MMKIEVLRFIDYASFIMVDLHSRLSRIFSAAANERNGKMLKSRLAVKPRRFEVKLDIGAHWLI